MMTKITIPGRFPSLNEYINSCRVSPYAGAAMKVKAEKQIRKELEAQTDRPLRCPVKIIYHYFEPTKRRDKSNIAGFFHKCFEDALVSAGLLPDDGWEEILGFHDSFDVDCDNPRIEVTIYEYGSKVFG